MKRRVVFPRASSLLLGLSVGSLASAQTLPLGGRTASMGGAGAAQGRDGAMPYVNPAGFGRVPHTTLSLSASLYRYQRLEIAPAFFHGNLPAALNLALTPDLDENRMESSRFTSFPGAAAVLWHFGPDDQPAAAHHVLGASILVSLDVDQVLEGGLDLTVQSADDAGITGTFGVRQTEVRSNTDYLFGPSYAYRKGDWSVGAGAFLAFTQSTRDTALFTQQLVGNDLLTTQSDTFRDFWSLGFQPIAGVQWQVTPRLALGASVALPSIPITGSLVAQARSEVSSTAGDALASTRSEGRVDVRFPGRFRLGAAWGKARDWMIAADVSLASGLDPAQESSFTQTTERFAQGEARQVSVTRERAVFDTRAALGLHAGGELFVTDSLALRLGAYYEQSPDILRLSREYELATSIDRLGVTFGVGLEDDIGETTLGIDLSGGRGRAIAGDAFGPEPPVAEVAAADLALHVFIAGAIDVGEFAKWASLARDPGRIVSPETRSLSLRDLPWQAQLSFDAPELADLREQRVDYVFTGERDFDRFFEQTARIRLAAQVAPLVLRELRASVARARAVWPRELASSLVSQTWQSAQRPGPLELPSAVRTLQGAPTLARSMQLAAALEALMKSMLRDAATLPERGSELIEEAHDAFTGPKVLLLPAVVSGLERSRADLVAASKLIAELLADYAGAFVELVGAVTLPEGGVLPPLEIRRLTLRDLDLTALEGGALDALSGGLEYVATGVPELDALLLRVARLRAASLEAKLLIEQGPVLWRRAEAAWQARGRASAELSRAVKQALAAGTQRLPSELAATPEARTLFDALLAARRLQRFAERILAEHARLAPQDRRIEAGLRAALSPLTSEPLLGHLRRAEPDAARDELVAVARRLQEVSE